MEKSGLRWGAIAGGGERFQVEWNDRWWWGAVSGGGERKNDRWWRRAIAGGGERSQVEVSDRWLTGAVAGRGEQSQVSLSGGEQSQVETVPAVGRVAILSKKNSLCKAALLIKW